MLTSTDRENVSNVTGRFVRIVAPLLLAVTLFVLNNLAVLSGWLNPPGGYAATLMVRA